MGAILDDHAKVIDASIRGRVLRGLARLEEKVGPDWPNRIDMDSLDLASGSRCVLGQVFAHHTITEEEWERFWRFKEHLDGQQYTDQYKADYQVAYSVESDGYIKGKIALNDNVFADPAEYGFESDDEVTYTDLDEAWGVILNERYGLTKSR